MASLKEKIIEYFEQGLSAKEIIEKGYKKSTVYYAIASFLTPKLGTRKAVVMNKDEWELIAETNQRWIFAKKP